MLAMAFQILSGVSRMSICRMLRRARASITAFATVTVLAIALISPAPFAPSELCGDEVSVRPTSNFGNPYARGIAQSIIEPVS